MAGKVVVVTGAAKGIGKAIADAFLDRGDKVFTIDKLTHSGFVGDVGNREDLERFVKEIMAQCDKIDYLINNAKPDMIGIDECSYGEFMDALAVGVAAPFYLTKLLAPYFAEGASVVNISSSRDRMSQPQTESYAAAKGGINALTHALAISFAGKARVNSVSPGWINTENNMYTGPDAKQQPVGRVGVPQDIVNVVLFLCSEKSEFIDGENICVDGGMTRQMIYHGEYGWQVE